MRKAKVAKEVKAVANEAASTKRITDDAHLGRLLLDGSYLHLEQPKGLKVPLYEHQQVVVQALMDLESARSYKRGNETITQSHAIRLAEPLGSGKTIEIIALIANMPIPKAFPIINSAPMEMTTTSRNRRFGTSSYPCNIVTTFDTKGTFIPLNLVVVGVSVLKQWHQSFQDFSSLKSFEVGDYHSLRKFKTMLDKRTYAAYNVIIVKNGMVSGNDLGMNNGKELHSILTVLGEYLRGKIVSRVVYDDFDVISIPTDARALNALSTVYVSATDKSAAKHQQVDQFTSIDEFLDRRVLLSNVYSDTVLSRTFAVRNEPSYVDGCLKLPICEIYTYTFVNPDDRLIGLAGKFGDAEGAQIVEMLNGDAVGEAAKALGIQSTSVADIFERLLDKQYKTYLNAKSTLAALTKTCENVQALAPHPKGKQAKMEKIDELRGKAFRGEAGTAKYYARNIIEALRAEMGDVAKQLDVASQAINRVTSNIKEDGCQTCKLPMEDEDAFIVRCCGLIVCGVCCVKCNQIKVQYSYKHKKQMPFGRCANCKADIDPTKDLIFINRDFNLQNLLTAKGDETTPIIAEAEPEPAVEETITDLQDWEKIKNPKLSAIYRILNNIKIAEQKLSTYKPKGLMEGRVNDPRPNGTPVKLIIFAGFNETLALIEKMFIEHNIEYLRLGGTATDRNETVKKFNTYGRVLLINSTENCGGLNLQVARDIVLFHAMTDLDSEAQAIARIMRIGGKYNARVHLLRYTNEA
jgi:Helicase conserved C-terminal domain/SNF2-related domain